MDRNTVMAAGIPAVTVGLDLADRWSEACVLEGSGEVVSRLLTEEGFEVVVATPPAGAADR
jgi:hypothetical protein